MVEPEYENIKLKVLFTNASAESYIPDGSSKKISGPLIDILEIVLLMNRTVEFVTFLITNKLIT